MNKKMLKVVPLVAGGLALSAVLTACGSSDEVESVEAQNGTQLQELLLTAQKKVAWMVPRRQMTLSLGANPSHWW